MRLCVSIIQITCNDKKARRKFIKDLRVLYAVIVKNFRCLCLLKLEHLLTLAAQCCLILAQIIRKRYFLILLFWEIISEWCK